jgi:hypothetical protein
MTAGNSAAAVHDQLTLGESRASVDATLRGFPHRLGKLIVGAVFQHESECPGLERMLGKDLTAMHRDYDDPGARRLRSHLGYPVGARSIRHPQTEHEHIRAVQSDLAEGSLSIARVGDHLQITLVVEQDPQRAAKRWVIIGQDHLNQVAFRPSAQTTVNRPQMPTHDPNLFAFAASIYGRKAMIPAGNYRCAAAEAVRNAVPETSIRPPNTSTYASTLHCSSLSVPYHDAVIAPAPDRDAGDATPPAKRHPWVSPGFVAWTDDRGDLVTGQP